MFQKKYLIMIGLAICLFILYFFYNEIIKVKTIIMPAYQKTMALEAKVLQLEKKTTELISYQHKKAVPMNESPALSITYQSDMVKNGNLSAKYSEISESEAKLIQKIENSKQSKTNVSTMAPNHSQKMTSYPVQKITEDRVQKPTIPIGDFSDHTNDQNEDAELNVNIANIINKQNNDTGIMAEYEKILNGLSDHENDNDELDADIIKSITESIKDADIPSENSLSELPLKPKTVKKNKRKQQSRHN